MKKSNNIYIEIPQKTERNLPGSVEGHLLFKSILMITFSAVLLFFAFPKFSISFAAFFALVPFFLTIRKLKTYRWTFFAGLCFGMLYIALLTYWIYFALHIHYGVSILMSIGFIIFPVCLPVGLLFGLFSISYKYFYSPRAYFYLLTVPSLWIIIEYVRGIFPFTIPWALLGYSSINLGYFVQIADIVGVLGISYIIVMINSVITGIISSLPDAGSSGSILHEISGFFKRAVNKRVFTLNRTAIISTLIVIAIVLGYGFYAENKWEFLISNAANNKSSIPVRIVQGNHNNEERWKDDNFLSRMELYMYLSDGKYKSRTKRIVVWPETVLNSSARMNEDMMGRIMGFIGRDSYLIAGGVRNIRNKEIYNSVYFVSGTGYVKWYDKNILLPFSETRPMNIGTLGRYFEAPDEFMPGLTNPSVEIEISRIGISVCFELIYPMHVRKSVLQGADLLVNVSNDGWFGDTAEPYQHLDIARFRALENRRYMVRASNNGISAVINPLGGIADHTQLFTRGALNSSVIRIVNKSVYAIIGDAVLYCALIVILVMLFKPFILIRKE